MVFCLAHNRRQYNHYSHYSLVTQCIRRRPVGGGGGSGKKKAFASAFLTIFLYHLDCTRGFRVRYLDLMMITHTKNTVAAERVSTVWLMYWQHVLPNPCSPGKRSPLLVWLQVYCNVPVGRRNTVMCRLALAWLSLQSIVFDRIGSRQSIASRTRMLHHV